MHWKMAGEICNFTAKNPLSSEQIRLLEIVQKQDDFNYCPILHVNDLEDHAIPDLATAWLIVNPELTAHRLDLARTKLLFRHEFHFRKLTNLVIGVMRAVAILNETEHCHYEQTWPNFPELKSKFNTAFWDFLTVFLASGEDDLSVRRSNHGFDIPKEVLKALSDACKECFERLATENLGNKLDEILLQFGLRNAASIETKKPSVGTEILFNLSYCIFNHSTALELLRAARAHYPKSDNAA